MTIGTLQDTANGNADANGRVELTLQPLRYGETWHVTRMTVQSSSSTLVPTAKVYQNSAEPSNLADGTYTGTFDTSTTSITLHNGERLLCVFEGADPGARCTFNIFGERNSG